MVKLTVCIPTRNRQKYCIQTIKDIAKSDEQDFEVIIGDNSDDHSIMADFFETFDDSRFHLVPPGNEVYSMVENWDRLIPFTKGEWLIYIGDDDYVDPELVKFITVTQAAAPAVDAISWSRIFYSWPEIQSPREVVRVPLGYDVYQLSQELTLRKMFYWDGASDRPACSFGIYHSAIKRDLMETIKETFGGKYFEHQVVDYENICKTIMVAKSMIYSERPMSVFGACGASNSAGFLDRKTQDIRIGTFLREAKNKLGPTNFPLSDDLGNTVIVARTILWFIEKYGLEVSGWEENFVKACSEYCKRGRDKTEFEIRRKGHAKAIRKWKGGKYLKYFDPVRKTIDYNGLSFQGVHENKLYVPAIINDVKTPAEFYDIVSGVMPSVELIENQLIAAAKIAAKAA
jgi:glycosyltransferase involved in cell wall biosynthesis